MPAMTKQRIDTNSILFTFDSIVDIPLGAIMVLRNRHSGGSDLLDYSFLSKTPDEIQRLRTELVGEDIFSMCFTENGKKHSKTIYDNLFTTREDERQIYTASPVTNMIKLVHSMAAYSGSGIRITLVGKNPTQVRVLQDIFKNRCMNLKIIAFEDYRKINTSMYSRIVIGDIHQLDELNSPKLRHFTILNYGSNLQLVNGEKVILPEYFVKYGNLNQMEVVAAYST